MKTRRFEMRMDPDTIARVDEWRTKQHDVPTRAEAIRRLVGIALVLNTTEEPRAEKRCDRCVFFRGYPHDPSAGTCFFNPPVVIPAKESDSENGVYFLRSEVDADAFCHEFKAK